MAENLESVKRDIDSLKTRARFRLPPLPFPVKKAPVTNQIPSPPAIIKPELPVKLETPKLVLPQETSITIPFRKRVNSLSTAEEEHRVPVDGILTSVIMHFPPGTNSLVEVRVLYFINKNKFFVVPSLDDSFIAMDGTTHPFPVNLPVVMDGKLRVEFKNYDGKFEHSVSVVAMITPKPKVEL